MPFKLISLLPSVSMVRERDNARILFLPALSKTHAFLRRWSTSSNFFHQLGHCRNHPHVALEVKNASNKQPIAGNCECPSVLLFLLRPTCSTFCWSACSHPTLKASAIFVTSNSNSCLLCCTRACFNLATLLSCRSSSVLTCWQPTPQ